MEGYLIIAIFFLTGIFFGIIYGILIQRYKIFPFSIFQNILRKLNFNNHENKVGPWSIGVFSGSSPFDLTEFEGISNPVLTAEDVTDIQAKYIADPFMLKTKEDYYIFFEMSNRITNKGEIGYASSKDGKRWKYEKSVLNEPFHLSYPSVFEWEDNYYLIPESFEDLSVRLYKATSFPEKWEHIGNLLNGYRYVDPSIFRFNNKWWLFVSTTESDVLNLYYSEDLLGSWTSHPANPIVKFNKHIARPGGRVIIHDAKPYRFAQDGDPYYGIQVFAFEITDLTEVSYTERMVSQKPIIGKSGHGWNSSGMHHIDLHKIGNKWMGVVDGQHK